MALHCPRYRNSRFLRNELHRAAIFSKLELRAAGRARQKQIRQRYHEGVPSACLQAASA